MSEIVQNEAEHRALLLKISNADAIRCWQDFDQFAPDEETCANLLFELFIRQKKGCRNCGGINFLRMNGARKFKCLDCRQTNWLTSGTLFHKAKHLRPWIGGLWLLENGCFANSLIFQKLASIVYSSALNIFRKLSAVLLEEMDNYEVPSALFQEVFERRSKDTPSKQHPREEEDAAQKSLSKQNSVMNHFDVDSTSAKSAHHASQQISQSDTQKNRESKTIKETEAESPQKKKEEKENKERQSRANGKVLRAGKVTKEEQTKRHILSFISAEPVSVDHLEAVSKVPINILGATLTMLELERLIVRLPGDRYILYEAMAAKTAPAKISKHPNCEPVIRQIINLLKNGHKAISRKYLQFYLAWHWSLLNKSQRSAGYLLEICFRHKSLKYSEIISYSSPLSVRIAGKQTQAI